MKSVQYRSIPLQSRFQLDDQWWIKVDAKTAKHASFDLPIDIKPSCIVLIAGDEQVTSASPDSSRNQMLKREGFFVLLGTWLESFHWLG